MEKKKKKNQQHLISAFLMEDNPIPTLSLFFEKHKAPAVP